MAPQVGNADERKADGARIAVLVGDGDLENPLGGAVELPLSGDVDQERGVYLGVLDHALFQLRKQLAVEEVVGSACVDGHGKDRCRGGAVGDEGEADTRWRRRSGRGSSRT